MDSTIPSSREKELDDSKLVKGRLRQPQTANTSTYLDYSYTNNKGRVSMILRLAIKQHFSLLGSGPRNLPQLSCKVEVERYHITIPSLYSTTSRCMASAENTQLLKPELTVNIKILCALRGISYETLGLAKSIILTYKYLNATFDTSAARNANYVIIPRTAPNGGPRKEELIIRRSIKKTTGAGHISSKRERIESYYHITHKKIQKMN